MAARNETELYAPVKSLLEGLGYEVKSEIHSCDLVAFKPGTDEPVIVELKKSFGLPVVYQGIERMKLSNHVYIAVEMRDDLRRGSSKKWKEAIKLCRMLGLGLMTVKFYAKKKPRVDLLCDPAPYEPRKNKRSSVRLLEEFHRRSADFNIGGSTRTKLVTAYREKALECAYWLEKEGQLTTKQLRELTDYKGATQLLYRDVYGWFQRMGKGTYQVNDKGRQALKAYRHVVDHKFNE
jgi:hypothetical protein